VAFCGPDDTASGDTAGLPSSRLALYSGAGRPDAEPSRPRERARRITNLTLHDTVHVATCRMRRRPPCNRLTRRPRSDGVKCSTPIDSDANVARGDAPRSGHLPIDALKCNRALGWNAKVARVVRFGANEIRCP